MDRSKRMGEGSVPRLLLAFSAPAIVGMLAQALYNVVDRIFIGRAVGHLGIAGIAVSFPFIVMPIIGINQGAQPIIGYNYGAERFDRVSKALRTAILAATAISSAGFLVAMVFPAQVLWLFHRDNPALLQLGTHALRICLMMFPIVGFQIVSANYFQAIGKPKHAMFLSLSRQVLLLIPAVLILPLWFGLDGVWAAMPCADLGSSLLTGVWLALELRHLHARHAEQTVVPTEPVVTPD